MSEYTISQVYPTDKTILAQIDTLLSQEGIRRDGNLDYICARSSPTSSRCSVRGGICICFSTPR